MKKYLRSYSWFTVDRFIANTVWTSIQYVISIGLNSIVSRMSELPKTTLFKFVESVKWSREWEKRDRSIVRSFVRSKFENSKIRKWKEKDARNSESTATENVFRLRSKKREGRGGGCLDAAASIRYITGAFTSPSHPLSLPSDSSALSPTRSLFLFSSLFVSIEGGFSRHERLCRHFPRGACALIEPPFSFLPLRAPCSQRLRARPSPPRCNGHCLRVKSQPLLTNDPSCLTENEPDNAWEGVLFFLYAIFLFENRILKKIERWEKETREKKSIFARLKTSVKRRYARRPWNCDMESL